MRTLLSIICAFLTVCLFVCEVRAEDINQIFKKVQELVVAKNYPKALEELTWASKEIEKMHNNQLRVYLPDELAGYTGDKFDASGALGITSVERTYRKGGGSEVMTVSVTGGSMGSAAAGGFGSLAALGSMAAMMGAQQEGSETLRIDGRTATLQLTPGSSSGDITIFLNSGSVLKVEMQQGANADALKSVAQSIKINDLDNYLKGAS